MEIGFTSTSFSQTKNLEKIVKIASESGAECIEWGADIHVKDVPTAKRVKSLCADAGIGISSYGSYYRVGSQNAQEWKNICEIAHAMGAKSIRVWLGNRDSEVTDEKTYKALVEDGKAICAVAKEYDLIVCPECHDNTFNNNTDAFLKIREDIGCDNFRTYFQSRYKRMEYDLDRLERTLPYIESVHISYSEQSREQFPKLNPKYIDALLDKINSLNFDGNILVEYTYLCCYAGFGSSMKKSIAKIKAKVGNKK